MFYSDFSQLFTNVIFISPWNIKAIDLILYKKLYISRFRHMNWFLELTIINFMFLLLNNWFFIIKF